MKIRLERSPPVAYSIICVYVPCVQDDFINSFQDYTSCSNDDALGRIFLLKKYSSYEIYKYRQVDNCHVHKSVNSIKLKRPHLSSWLKKIKLSLDTASVRNAHVCCSRVAVVCMLCIHLII